TNNNYLSKVPVDPADGYPDADNATLPPISSGNLPVEHEYGSLFFFPPTLGDTLVAMTIKYRAARSNVIPGETAAPITAKIYKFTDQDNNGFWTQAFSTSEPELALAGIGYDTFPLVGGTGAYLGREMDVIDINSANLTVGMPFESNAFYFVSLLQSNVNGLRNA